jgi:hypothetical protein
VSGILLITPPTVIEVLVLSLATYRPLNHFLVLDSPQKDLIIGKNFYFPL